jgi:hypothetical protein
LRKLEDPSVKTTGPEPTQAPTKGGLHLDMLKYAFFSGSPFTFRVEIAPVTHNETPLTLLFKWNGDWRLVRIFLPAKAIEAVGSKVTEAGRSPSRDGDLSVSKSGSPPPAVAEKPSEQPKTPEAAPIWTIKESKSPIDDSRQIEGFLFAISDSEPVLGLRCKEKKTEAFFGKRFAYFSSGDSVKVLTRINDGPPIETVWTGASQGYGVFAPSAIQFIRSLPDNGKLFIRAHGFRGQTTDGEFNLGNVSELREKLSRACNWPAERSLPLGSRPATVQALPSPPKTQSMPSQQRQ